MTSSVLCTEPLEKRISDGELIHKEYAKLAPAERNCGFRTAQQM